jgi:hypothetical protein
MILTAAAKGDPAAPAETVVQEASVSAASAAKVGTASAAL